MTSHWLLAIKVEHVLDPSSDLAYSKQPSARQCHTANPSSVLLFLSLMSSPFCATKTQLSVLEAHFSDPYAPSYFFFLWLFSGYWAWWELGRRVRHHTSSLPAHLLWLKRLLLLKHIQFIPQWASALSLRKHCMESDSDWHAGAVPGEPRQAWGGALVWGPTRGIKGTALKKWLRSSFGSCQSGSDTQTSSSCEL